MKAFEKRLLEEYKESMERLNKLNAALDDADLREEIGDYQFALLHDQAKAMREYHCALTKRVYDLGLIE